MEMDIDNSPGPKDGEEEEGKGKGKQIVVILVGPPGSGKSTFCERVISSSLPSHRLWSRICQDTINNGKAGTKPQCLKSAVAALNEGKSVFIDRCNLEREQRAEFVKLGCLHVDVHAVVLDLPAQLCISRSVKRTGHEGNLQGGKAAAVVNRMLQKKELPKLNEGFSRILFCCKESEVDAAINAYSELGPYDTLPHGIFGEKGTDTKIQAGIMRFLKKVGPPSNEPSKTEDVRGSECSKLGNGNDRCSQGPETTDLTKVAIGDDLAFADLPTLAFPSISTADFQFDNEKASDIIVETVQEFVSKLGNARLVIVDLSHGSKILSLVRTKAAQRNIDSKKFFTFVGDITKLYSQGGLRCNVIANAANWRLKPGGGGVNAAIYSAAGPSLEAATKERANSLLPGHTVVVPLPSSSPLHSREGISHVIHVLGPNMNPQRPNFLNNDYSKGCKILREAYSSLFDCFISIVKTQANLPERGVSFIAEPGGLRDPSPGDTTNQKHSDKKFKRHRGSQDETGHDRTALNSTSGQASEDGGKIDGSTKSWGSWALALYHIARHPEMHKNVLLEISDDFVVLNDLYPKAQKHLLVLTRVEGLDQLADLCKEHLQLLLSMHTVGLKWAEKFVQEDPSLVFRLGYHSVPSMRQLHLHVVSQDFNSNHLKNKKHWNSFNSPFFRDSVDVIAEIKEHGKATLKDEDNYLSMELRCNRCRSAHPNIPRLKFHISRCQAPFPSTLCENGRLVLAASAPQTE